MKTTLIHSVLLSSAVFAFSPIILANTSQGHNASRCQSSCAGIPKGQCSCVTTDGIKCCGKKTDGLTSKPSSNN
ncbi:Uncharacterised protein [Legionella beliardensis]|uniref:Secreted protein n=1 Tax=Legionella beliardensis TaxID=91822 RepID=A0A378HZW5_9GAMM|nr:hypothetical protein [Legionella beliardensis]STX28272.1 Uncharacterised protein [Legionella beliardensis]